MSPLLLNALLQFALISATPEPDKPHEGEMDLFDKSKAIPFSFVYEGSPSTQFLSSWTHEAMSSTSFGGPIVKTENFRNPITGLEVRFSVIEYMDFPVQEWVVHLKNTGNVGTPVLEEIQALDLTLHGTWTTSDLVLHYAKGVTCSMEDFRPMIRVLNRGTKASFKPGGGRSDQRCAHLQA